MLLSMLSLRLYCVTVNVIIRVVLCYCQMLSLGLYCVTVNVIIKVVLCYCQCYH